jgi:hypothetical protein
MAGVYQHLLPGMSDEAADRLAGIVAAAGR